MKSNYIKLQDLDVYKLARELSRLGWAIYDKLTWQDKKVIGDQFITSTDSFGANLTEGYSRYHYLDKIKFYYNARASLAEANDYWVELLFERKKISIKEYKPFKNLAISCSIKLQNFIKVHYTAKENNK